VIDVTNDRMYLADNMVDVAVVTWDVHVELEFLLHVGGSSP